MAAVTPEIIGRNFEITPDVRHLLESRLERIEDKLFNDVVTVRVVLQVEKYRNICEIFIAARDHDVKAIQESDVSMQDAINAALDHAKRQAQKHRERLTDHHKNDAALLIDSGDSVGDAGRRDAGMAASSTAGPGSEEVADSDPIEREARR